jgi:hypothetical protein
MVAVLSGRSRTKPPDVSQIDPAASRWIRSHAGDVNVAVESAEQVFRMASAPRPWIAFSSLMSHQSTVSASLGMKLGWMTVPRVIVVPFSGVRVGLPPSRPLYWPAGLAVGD